jgi:hypothetical protein
MPDPRRGSSQAEPSQKELVATLEEKLDRLRVSFEQYFLGIEKRPPLGERSEVQRLIRQLQGKRIPQTSIRFQFQALVGRFNILDSYWTRVLRKIEDGTYERDLFKVRLKAQLADPAGRPVEQGEMPAPAEPPRADYGLTEEKIRQVFESYVRARRHTGEPVDALTYERVRATLLREAPKIAERNGAARVEYQVVVRDGRAILKAIPVKES